MGYDTFWSTPVDGKGFEISPPLSPAEVDRCRALAREFALDGPFGPFKAGCDWIVTDDGSEILLPEGPEERGHPIEWMELIMRDVILPGNHRLSGEVCWDGEDARDEGRIVGRGDRLAILDKTIADAWRERGVEPDPPGPPLLLLALTEDEVESLSVAERDEVAIESVLAKVRALAQPESEHWSRRISIDDLLRALVAREISRGSSEERVMEAVALFAAR